MIVFTLSLNVRSTDLFLFHCDIHTFIHRVIPHILTLMCYVLGRESNSVFPVKIVTTKTAGQLRDTIKAKDTDTPAPTNLCCGRYRSQPIKHKNQ